MKEKIVSQLIFMCFSYVSGLVIILIYDIFRKLRKYVPIKYGWIVVGDFLYFTVSACLFFYACYAYNYGILRFYIIAMVFAGGITGLKCISS